MGSQTPRQLINGNNNTTDDISNLLPSGELPELNLGEQVTLTPLDEFCLARWNVRQEDLPANIIVIISRMEEYIKRMNGKVVIPSTTIGAENQLYLINTFMRALSYENDEMIRSLDVLLFIMNENRNDTFRDEMVYRFIPFIRRPAEDLDAYAKILEILLKIASPLERSQMARSDRVKRAITLINPTYKQATFALVTYLSQY